jgi:hypothetical protein
MAINTRQNSLLVAENWKKIYQTFQEADFTSYDFETLRKSMVDYLRLYYPEDYNDFTESSEFIALIDLIAFLGQSIAFRADLNARENFIDTAERRDSILKLARLISYNPKRNICASGFLKIESINTTETLYDSNGLNLSNLNVNWNDQTNDNWLEQFTTVLNASLVTTQTVGKPGNSQTINNIKTDEYSINFVQNVLGVYKFTAAIEGSNFDFEAVSATTVGKSYVYEVPPNLNAPFNILYRNDNYGNASNDTGFFVYFKQGALGSHDFTISDAIPNKIVSFTDNNVNNSDTWLYAVDSNTGYRTAWTEVPAISGVNVIYNDTNKRNLFQVNTRAGDQVDLVFGDGSFANIPRGNFKFYYRSSNGLSYKITPEEMKNISIPLNYVSRSGRVETLTLRASLQYTVTNANARESTSDIKQKAPQQYYTQNRMITGEDYNILPYTSFGNVVKAKAINRTSSGISRFLDVIDSTGKYSSTNIFASDGILYENSYTRNIKFSFNTSTDIAKIINNEIIVNIVNEKELLHFYYANYPTYASANLKWKLSTLGSNVATGYFTTPDGVPTQIGGVVQNSRRYIRKGSTIKFTAPAGYYFDASNNLVAGTATDITDQTSIFASVMEVFGDGTNNGLGNMIDGTGPVLLNVRVPSNAVVGDIYPVFKNSFTTFFSDSIISKVKSYKNFGLGYDSVKQVWFIINNENLNTGSFSLSNQSDESGTGLDSSWLIRFEYNSDGYTVYYRGIEYIMESVKETTFYYDNKIKIYDTKTASVISDQVTVLKTNNEPNSAAPLAKDYTWYVYKPFVESDGYVHKDKIFVTYADSNNDGVPDNPDLFKIIVDPTVNTNRKYVYFQSVTGYERFTTLIPVDNKTVVSLFATRSEVYNNTSLYLVGQLFYAYQDDKFYSLSTSRTLVEETNYVARIGRQNISFQYRHNSPDYRRIDPSTTNVIDIYMLTSAYETAYRQWIQDTSDTISKPAEPTNYELSTEFASLNDIKTLSDTLVFNCAKFKLIFGYKAPSSLQATFKVVKNTNVNISDNDIKTSVISAVNTYFDIGNWEFGETFYFSELSAYLHKALSPYIASIMVVPVDSSVSFGSMYQINAEPNEIIISAATVENVEIISAVTANQLNITMAAQNKNIIV